MTDKAGDIAMLIKKHIHNELTGEERRTLNNWIDESNENRQVFNEMTNEDSLREAMQEFYDFTRNHDRGQSMAVVGMHHGKTNWIKYFLAAAVVIIAVSLIWLLALNNKNGKQVAVTDTAAKTMTADIPPGGNKAVLILADGSTIKLDDARNGVIAEQGKTVINKKNGELVYNEGKVSTKGNAISWNTVTTPRGGQYQLSLPDGSKVSLNAASSLRFPVSFSGDKRVVKLEGEAYFEVAPSFGKNGKRPFIVEVNGMEVEVLGTHFNIMAYADEPDTKTTLIEGSVKVSNGSSVTILKARQQALTTTGNTTTGIRVNNEADVMEAIAWKNGVFQFNNADLKTVMRNIARWYDVDISYEGQLPEKRFTGRMSRNMNASEVLSGIEFIGVHFKIGEKKIVVLP
jgi:transmembrane sensor